MKKNKILTIITVSIMSAVALTACICIPLTASVSSDSETQGDSAPAAVSDGRINILVAGCDRTSGLTDVLMLLSVDGQSGRAAVLQIPRDTYAEYTSGSYKKLNGAYSAMGAEDFCSFLSTSLGVPIDRYIYMSPDALVGVVDALGGVEICLDEPMRYSDPEQGLYISLAAGWQVLDGKKAEQFIRYRSGYADGDLGRLDAQKIFLCGLLEAVRKNTDPMTVARITATLIGKTETNITPSDGITLAQTALSLDTSQICVMTAPGEAVVASKSGASYYSLSSAAMSELLREYFGASSGGFDRDRVFLNERYENFSRVYAGYSEYRVHTVKSLWG